MPRRGGNGGQGYNFGKGEKAKRMKATLALIKKQIAETGRCSMFDPPNLPKPDED